MFLGLSDTDRQKLVDNVNVIFHVAASVRFDDPLKYAILLNTRGTREVAQLALDTKNLAVSFPEIFDSRKTFMPLIFPGTCASFNSLFKLLYKFR